MKIGMADEFSFTDSDEERAVEDVLSEAMDHSVLEQIAKINCSADALPSDLEYRFRKLKSKSKSFTGGSPNERNLHLKKSPPYTEYSDGNRDSKAKPKPKYSSFSNRSCKSNYSSRSGSFRSVSPVRRSICCLWSSPKKKEKENQSGDDYDVDFFKTKEHKKIMRRAIKEEEKLAKEAEKIVKWAKQASDRMMDVSALDDQLLFSDLEDDTN